MRKAAIIIFLFILVVTTYTADPLRCSICGQEIHGSYIRYEDGSVFCNECAAKYPHCAMCGKPSLNTTTIDGKPICRDCLAKLDRCSFCGRALTGDFLRFPELNLKLCDRCAKTVPRCDLCGKPDKNLIEVGDRHICKSCYEKSDFCYICGNPIQGEYLWFDTDSTKKYCRQCVDEYPRCSSCGAPVGRHSVKLDDGRVLCRDCYNDGYFKPGKVSEIKNQVLTYLESRLNMKVNHFVKYTLQGSDFIKEKSEGLSGDLNGLFYRHGDIYEIYVLYGLRKRDLYQVIAHETAHAWAAENLRDNLTLEEAEGFAQWISYYALQYFGYNAFSKTLTEGDNEYARGLRMMLEIEKRSGQKAIFDYLAK